MPSGGEPSTEALNLGNGPKTVVPICWDLNGDGPPVSEIFSIRKEAGHAPSPFLYFGLPASAPEVSVA